MRATLIAGAGVGLLIFATQAQGPDSGVPPTPESPPPLEWHEWSRTLLSAGRATASPAGEAAVAAGPELDVVDAHWMALTMWGEARGDGEEAMRAVGHVIDNRRRAAAGDAAFVTDTVSAAFQFSCWNPDDPNLAAMQSIDRLRPGSREHLMWLAARRLAEEILAGVSQDPTGGALFYHAIEAAPAWSAGIQPVRSIGRHLFFRTARRA